MKKSVLSIAFAAVAMLFASCQSSSTPETDSTKLYPAMDASGNYWGYINNKGVVVITPMFDNAEGFSCGYARVLMGDDVMFIDKNGKFQAASSFDQVSPFYYGYSTFVLDGKYGLMGKDFSMSIQPYFDGLSIMGDNGLVVAQRTNDSKLEYVNAKGETKIAAMYNQADDFKDGLAIIRLNDKYGAIDKSGSYLLQPVYRDGLWNMGKGLVGYCNDKGSCGIMDKGANIIVAAMYDGLGVVSDDMIRFLKDDKYGYLDAKGNMVLPAMFTTATAFSEGYAWVKQSETGRYMNIDKKGQVLAYLGDDEAPVNGFHNGLALVMTNDGYKYVDYAGAVIYSWSMTPANSGTDEETDYDVVNVSKMDIDQHNALFELDRAYIHQTLYFSSQKL